VTQNHSAEAAARKVSRRANKDAALLLVFGIKEDDKREEQDEVGKEWVMV
jgi:hypothetical protein